MELSTFLFFMGFLLITTIYVAFRSYMGYKAGVEDCLAALYSSQVPEIVKALEQMSILKSIPNNNLKDKKS